MIKDNKWYHCFQNFELEFIWDELTYIFSPYIHNSILMVFMMFKVYLINIIKIFIIYIKLD